MMPLLASSFNRNLAARACLPAASRELHVAPGRSMLSVCPEPSVSISGAIQSALCPSGRLTEPERRRNRRILTSATFLRHNIECLCDRLEFASAMFWRYTHHSASNARQDTGPRSDPHAKKKPKPVP